MANVTPDLNRRPLLHRFAVIGKQQFNAFQCFLVIRTFIVGKSLNENIWSLKKLDIRSLRAISTELNVRLLAEASVWC